MAHLHLPPPLGCFLPYLICCRHAIDNNAYVVTNAQLYGHIASPVTLGARHGCCEIVFGSVDDYTLTTYRRWEREACSFLSIRLVLFCARKQWALKADEDGSNQLLAFLWQNTSHHNIHVDRCRLKR